MEVLMRAVLWAALLLPFLTVASSCEKTVVVDTRTQVLVRISSSDAELKANLTQLRVSAALRDPSGWRAPDVDLYTAAELKWPVDVPVFPRDSADASKQFEVVVDALSNDVVLARAHVITSFRPGAHLLLEVPLFRCPGHTEPFVCGDEGCRGEACTVCGMSGQCIEVPTVDPIDPADAPMPPGTENDAGEPPSDMDAGSDGAIPDGAAQDGTTAQDGAPDPNDCPAAGACSNGTCQDGLGTYTCNCNEGYTGTGTQLCTKVLYCPKDACAPGGTCVDVPNWSCMCNAGYTGTGTQACTNVNDCPADTCRAPNGSCQDLVGGYKCNCDAGFSGDNCENDACGPNPCQHGGTCSRATSGAVCACGNSGYTGTLCETDIDECAQANACANPAYACAQTTAPGYACLGQFADWHMPDAVPASKFAPSYDTGTAGVVRDLVTGLMWERVWDSRTHTWEGAKTYCNALGLGGFDDWRMPSKIELETLLDETRASAPLINTSVFPGTLAQTTYWSSSPNVEVPGTQSAWVLMLETGLSSYMDTTSTTSIRCVRTAALASGVPSGRYVVDAAADIVTDTRTTLVWQRTLSASLYTWDGATTYCAGRGAGWRVPALKELLTLIDPARINPAIASVFPDTPGTEFWSSSSIANDGTYAWLVTMYNGYTDGYLKTSMERVRCVR